ncbi:MAG: hypothetical protein QGH91_04950 [Candidatus Marinimicrobia bacterium]|jgi:hypothetical protein|nr:hypothetical protein [Candidatus Neomarinimicrobiota bacterium]MDP7216935.1 hypothetical protein [Candidatus Neomarinimicrobiota bacterium]MDP7437142.1 hypothetical protein [Candidatus Neomarinimicrobiota bacterium]
MDKHIKYLYIIMIAGFLSLSVQLWLQHRAIQAMEIKIEAIRELLFRFV